jgi:uncharacterized protein
LIFILLAVSFGLFALEVPQLKGTVNDYAGVLSKDQEHRLESLLRETEKQTASQVVLLTIPSLQGENLEDYSFRVAEKWQLGQKELDNGVLLLVSMQEKKIRIEVGYGLESTITDLKSGYIIRKFIVPEFKQGNFYQGISKGLVAITGLISNDFEISQEELAKYQQELENSGGHLPIGGIVFLIMIVLGSLGRRGRRGGILPWLIVGSMLGGGRDHGGGFGGGGFGGFSGGGGSFGGGGASGGW